MTIWNGATMCRLMPATAIDVAPPRRRNGRARRGPLQSPPSARCSAACAPCCELRTPSPLSPQRETIFSASFAVFAFKDYAKAALIAALSVNSLNAAILPLRNVNTIANGESNVLPVALVLAR